MLKCLIVGVANDPRGMPDVPHYEDYDNEHNSEYDHEAFLGKDEANEFEKLPPEEAKRRLG